MNFTMIWKTLIHVVIYYEHCASYKICFLKILIYQLIFVYNYYFCVFSGGPGDHVQQHVQHDQQSTDSRGLPQVHIRRRPGPGPGHTFWGCAEVCPDHWFWWVRHMVKWRTVCRYIPTIHQTFNEFIVVRVFGLPACLLIVGICVK